MPRFSKQAQAANHIRELLVQRGFNNSSRRMRLSDNQEWIVFERGGRQVGIDMASGIWIKSSQDNDWRCIAMPHSISGALMAVDFLTAN